MMKKSYWFLGWIIMLVLTSCSTPASTSKKSLNNFQLSPILKYPSEIPESKKEITKKEFIARKVNQPKITNFWEETDIRTVLQDIASQAKVTIIIDETIQPTPITLEVKDLPLEETLKMVLLTGGYFKRIKDTYGEYYLVGSGMPDSLISLNISESKKFITNRPAKEIYPLLNSSLSPFVTKSGENDYFIVATAPPYILDKIEEQVKLIDQPLSQIVIEIMVCESKWNKDKSIGIDWSQVLKIQGAAKAAWQRGQQWTYAGKLGADLEGSIQALVQDGRISIKAKPKIVVEEGEEAIIDVSTDFYVNLYGQEPQPQVTANFSENNIPYYSFTRYRAEPIRVGVVLKVKPRISREGEVSLNIQSDVSNLLTVKSDGLPVVSRRSVKTTIRIESGETVTIGGLYQENSQESFSGLPGSSKKYLFLGTKKSSKEGTELMIFLTPRILGKV